MRILKKGRCRRFGSLLAEVESEVSPVGKMHGHEPAAAYIAAAGMNHGQGVAHGHRRIHRIAPFAQDLNPGLSRQVLGRDHHGVGRHHGPVRRQGLGRGERAARIQIAIGIQRRCRSALSYRREAQQSDEIKNQRAHGQLRRDQAQGCLMARDRRVNVPLSSADEKRQSQAYVTW